jgi:nitronate monooxygenase
VERALEDILNLLLESERAGVAALDGLVRQVDNEDLKRLLAISREDEAATVSSLQVLIANRGGQPSTKTGAFAAKVAAAPTLRERLRLLIHGEEWVARKVEEAMAIAQADNQAVQEYLRKMAQRHRFEVEWGRAELIRLMDTLE